MKIGPKAGLGKGWGHKLAEVLAIRAENENLHTNSARSVQPWPPKRLVDGQKIDSNPKIGFCEFPTSGYKKKTLCRTHGKTRGDFHFSK